MQVALQGIPDIRKVSIREAQRIAPDSSAPEGYSNDSEWVLDTEGVNLQEVSHPAVMTNIHVQQCATFWERRLSYPDLSLREWADYCTFGVLDMLVETHFQSRIAASVEQKQLA